MFLFDNVDETHNIHNIDCTYSSVSTVAQASTYRLYSIQGTIFTVEIMQRIHVFSRLDVFM